MGELFLAGALGGRADDHAGIVGNDLLQDRLESLPLGVGQLAADAGHAAAGHVDQEPAGQRDLAGQPGALVPDRVLGDLHEDRVAGVERALDGAGLAFETGGVPVDLAGVQHAVAALADVDERRLHARQHVLHPAEIDVADVGGRARPGHVVLDQDVVLEHRDLGAIAALAHGHDPVDRLAAGQELGLGQDRRALAAGFAAVAAALPLGLEPGRPLDAANAVVVAIGVTAGRRDWSGWTRCAVRGRG